jgi:hypothetical protein
VELTVPNVTTYEDELLKLAEKNNLTIRSQVRFKAIYPEVRILTGTTPEMSPIELDDYFKKFDRTFKGIYVKPLQYYAALDLGSTSGIELENMLRVAGMQAAELRRYSRSVEIQFKIPNEPIPKIQEKIDELVNKGKTYNAVLMHYHFHLFKNLDDADHLYVGVSKNLGYVDHEITATGREIIRALESEVSIADNKAYRKLFKTVSSFRSIVVNVSDPTRGKVLIN